MKVPCPHCAAQSGGSDYWGEWSECECCNPEGDNETGWVETKRLAEFNARIAALDAEIDRLMRGEGMEPSHA